ncbi:hypothetical protein [Psychrobacillus sp. NPDC096623]|uniref:hypothetical protein n=1 Tax=Psychrobacillus sp. NPDC096623 TaxID=3364492 RepID=UPI003824C358
MFDDFKNKKYWILMPPFLILLFALIFYLPENYGPAPFIFISVIIAFWTTYYLWNYIDKNKKDR